MVILTLPSSYETIQQSKIVPNVWVPYSLRKIDPLIQVPSPTVKNSPIYAPVPQLTPETGVSRDPSLPHHVLTTNPTDNDPAHQHWYTHPKNGKPKSNVPSVTGQIITSMKNATRMTLPRIELIQAFLPTGPTTSQSVRATLFIDPSEECFPRTCANTITPTKGSGMDIDSTESSEQKESPNPPPHDDHTGNDNHPNANNANDEDEDEDEDTVHQSGSVSTHTHMFYLHCYKHKAPPGYNIASYTSRYMTHVYHCDRTAVFHPTNIEYEDPFTAETDKRTTINNFHLFFSNHTTKTDKRVLWNTQIRVTTKLTRTELLTLSVPFLKASSAWISNKDYDAHRRDIVAYYCDTRTSGICWKHRCERLNKALRECPDYPQPICDQLSSLSIDAPPLYYTVRKFSHPDVSLLAFQAQKQHMGLAEDMIYHLATTGQLPTYGISDTSQLLTKSEMFSPHGGVRVQTVLEHHQAMEKSLTTVHVSNITQRFLDFNYRVNDDDTTTTIGGHMATNASYDCIQYNATGAFIMYIMKNTVRENWLRNFNNYRQLIINYNDDNPQSKISVPVCKQAPVPREPTPSLRHFRQIQANQPPPKLRRTKQRPDNRPNAWETPPSIIHQHVVSPNDTQTRSVASSLNDTTNTKTDISFLTQTIMTQLEEKFEAESAKNDVRFNAQTAKIQQLSTTIASNNERLKKVENENTNNQKNFDELKMMMQALLNREPNNVQINDNNKRLHEESQDGNLS